MKTLSSCRCGIVKDVGSIIKGAKGFDLVRNLPANVGSRIQKCVYEALKKNPPNLANKGASVHARKNLFQVSISTSL